MVNQENRKAGWDIFRKDVHLESGKMEGGAPATPSVLPFPVFLLS
jgi:hypothetical protein